MGNEAAVPECPQQVIDLLHRLTIRGVNVDGVRCRVCSPEPPIT
jgi:hypothetical protein